MKSSNDKGCHEAFPLVRLRAMEPEDLDMLYRIENDKTLWNVGTTNVPYSRYALHDYMANVSNDIYVDRQLRLIVENGDGETVGIVDLVDFDPQHRRAEIGIVIANKYRCRGYATEALGLLAEYAVSVLHLHQLYVVVDAYNEPSVALFSKLGYSTVSLIKDWLFDGKKYHDALLMQTFL